MLLIFSPLPFVPPLGRVVLDQKTGIKVGRMATLSGTVAPKTHKVQVLVWSDADNVWYVQPNADVKKNGKWKAGCTFGGQTSLRTYQVVALSGEKNPVPTSTVKKLPGGVATSGTISVSRVR